MSLFKRAMKVADDIDARIAASAATIERGVEAVITETEKMATAAIDAFDDQAFDTFGAMLDYKQKLIEEIERKNSILSRVQETIDRLHSIGLNPDDFASEQAASEAPAS
jgi:hypothetical protein